MTWAALKTVMELRGLLCKGIRYMIRVARPAHGIMVILMARREFVSRRPVVIMLYGTMIFMEAIPSTSRMGLGGTTILQKAVSQERIRSSMATKRVIAGTMASK